MALYIHIPFCSTKCSYCDFYTSPQTARMSVLLDAIRKEWTLRAGEGGVLTPRTVYIGGGTPSLIEPNQFARWAEWIPVTDKTVEFTIEANPDDITPERIQAWKHAGVNRVSLGVQSFDDQVLRAIGRRHNAAQAIQAVQMLQQQGINNISIDLIYTLPGQSIESWQHSLDTMLALGVQHFSAYILSVEPGTRLHAALSVGKWTPADDETALRMYDMLCNAAARGGFDHYEIANFGLPGLHSRHNSAYWDFSAYIGLGPAAHSFDGTLRRYNPSNLKQYLADLAQNKTSFAIEEETPHERINDRIMVALRTAKGLNLSTLDTPIAASILKKARTLPPGMVQITPHNITIPENQMLMSDAIIRHLFL